MKKQTNYKIILKAIEIAMLMLAIIVCCAVLSAGQLSMTYTIVLCGLGGLAIGWMLVEIVREIRRDVS